MSHDPAAYDGVELFAGPGGLSTGAAVLGLNLLGIETDDAAVATRIAAGHPTHHGSVLDVDPRPWTGTKWLCGGPPCQTFSQAGKGSGRKQLDLVLHAVKRLGAGEWPAEEIEATHDQRTTLVLEPLRWALIAEPQRIMLEQVPGVLPVWEAIAEVLRANGYKTWTGKLNAEEYGVPQTRKRAILLARLDGEPVGPPEPTHRRYRVNLADGGRNGDDAGDLFAGDLLPFVTMAEALGWGMTARPYPTIACSRSTGGPDMEKVGGSAARAIIYAERDAGRWVAPPPPVDRTQLREVVQARLADQTGTPVNLEWPADRPATVVAGRDLVQHPGATANRFNGSTKSRNDGIRVTLEEAATLQSFPDGYPWQGNSSKQHQQVGNAVPPLLARAALKVLL